MKNKLKFIYGIIILCTIFWAKEVCAFTTSIIGEGGAELNKTVTVTVKISGATDLVALDAEFYYDKNHFDLVSAQGQDGWQVVVGKKIAATNANGVTGSSSVVKLTFRLKQETNKSGFQVELRNVKGSNSNIERQVGTNAVKVLYQIYPASSNNNLTSLTVDGKSVSGFSAAKTTYDLGTTTASSINISASTEDSKATVSGTGTKKVGYGKNTYNVVVTAENGSKKTYKVVITKPDTRNKDNTLSSLSAEPLNLKFNKNTTSYSFKVEHDVKSIKISAKANDSKASVSGTGTKTLKDYTNTFKVIVTAENETKKTYTIKVIRKDADGNLGEVSKDNTLKKLSIDGYNIDFKKDTLEYNLEVDNLVDSIKVDATANDSNASLEISGNEDLSVGTNAVKIIVTAENGDIKTYVINVTRKSDAPSTTIKELDKVLEKTTAKEIIIDVKDENTELTKETLTSMKNSKKTFTINNYNENIINYSWSIEGKNIGDTKSIDTSIKFNSENAESINKLTNYADSVYLDFAHEGELPKGTKIKIYVGDRYEDGTKVNVYHYDNDKNKMNDIKTELEVKNGYVEFGIEHCSEYIITRALLNQKKTFNPFLLISIIEFLIIIGYIAYKYLKVNKKKTKKK